jgi:hypothetical protein
LAVPESAAFVADMRRLSPEPPVIRIYAAEDVTAKLLGWSDLIRARWREGGEAGLRKFPLSYIIPPCQPALRFFRIVGSARHRALPPLRRFHRRGPWRTGARALWVGAIWPRTLSRAYRVW